MMKKETTNIRNTNHSPRSMRNIAELGLFILSAVPILNLIALIIVGIKCKKIFHVITGIVYGVISMTWPDVAPFIYLVCWIHFIVVYSMHCVQIPTQNKDIKYPGEEENHKEDLKRKEHPKRKEDSKRREERYPGNKSLTIDEKQTAGTQNPGAQTAGTQKPVKQIPRTQDPGAQTAGTQTSKNPLQDKTVKLDFRNIDQLRKQSDNVRDLLDVTQK